jgi:hypothetical protein
MRRVDCHDRLKQVKSNYHTAHKTVGAFIKVVTQQPEYLRTHDLNVSEMQNLLRELHDVYFVRMFACFELSLRNYWRKSVRDTKPFTQQLLSSIAGRRGVPQDALDAVQEIREFRNYLIHEEVDVKKRFTIDEASSHLNSYVSRLPLEW